MPESKEEYSAFLEAQIRERGRRRKDYVPPKIGQPCDRNSETPPGGGNLPHLGSPPLQSARAGRRAASRSPHREPAGRSSPVREAPPPSAALPEAAPRTVRFGDEAPDPFAAVPPAHTPGQPAPPVAYAAAPPGWQHPAAAAPPQLPVWQPPGAAYAMPPSPHSWVPPPGVYGGGPSPYAYPPPGFQPAYSPQPTVAFPPQPPAPAPPPPQPAFEPQSAVPQPRSGRRASLSAPASPFPSADGPPNPRRPRSQPGQTEHGGGTTEEGGFLWRPGHGLGAEDHRQVRARRQQQETYRAALERQIQEKGGSSGTREPPRPLPSMRSDAHAGAGAGAAGLKVGDEELRRRREREERARQLAAELESQIVAKKLQKQEEQRQRRESDERWERKLQEERERAQADAHAGGGKRETAEQRQRRLAGQQAAAAGALTDPRFAPIRKTYHHERKDLPAGQGDGPPFTFEKPRRAVGGPFDDMPVGGQPLKERKRPRSPPRVPDEPASAPAPRAAAPPARAPEPAEPPAAVAEIHSDLTALRKGLEDAAGDRESWKQELGRINQEVQGQLSAMRDEMKRGQEATAALRVQLVAGGITAGPPAVDPLDARLADQQRRLRQNASDPPAPRPPPPRETTPGSEDRLGKAGQLAARNRKRLEALANISSRIDSAQCTQEHTDQLLRDFLELELAEGDGHSSTGSQPRTPPPRTELAAAVAARPDLFEGTSGSITGHKRMVPIGETFPSASDAAIDGSAAHLQLDEGDASPGAPAPAAPAEPPNTDPIWLRDDCNANASASVVISEAPSPPRGIAELPAWLSEDSHQLSAGAAASPPPPPLTVGEQVRLASGAAPLRRAHGCLRDTTVGTVVEFAAGAGAPYCVEGAAGHRFWYAFEDLERVVRMDSLMGSVDVV
eukprot:TRINITY_DN21781_c0_g1_i1.p1 TRINITY_DN21781_c0_g1~~TRINITY_DN21781_c0_g1_i1.p1  ORF type:complete len:934 (+),score=128.05 TRINITY_DN21781_c0_g1_i1:102-2804(+)